VERLNKYALMQPIGTSYKDQTVAQVVLHYLKLEGVNTFFGVPGGSLSNLLAEMKHQREAFNFIVCRHETGAAYIADGYFRATGNLGVVMTTSGPGATNALTGAMNAQADGSSMLVITGEVSEPYFGKGYLQEGMDAELDLHAIYKAASCYSVELTDQSETQTLIEQALRSARSKPCGMAHISIPNNVSTERVTTPAPPPAAPSPVLSIPNSPSNYRVLPGGIEREKVREALQLLLACKRPVIFLGSGCRESLRDPSLLSSLLIIAERYAIPVMTTADGKGVFPESNPLSLRVYGCSNNTWAGQWLQQTEVPYDGILVLGTSLRGLSSNNWNPILIPKAGGPFIQVDLQQHTIGRGFPVSLGLVGEIGAFLRAAIGMLSEFPPNLNAVADRQATMAAIQATSPFYSEEQYHSEASPIEPAALVRVLQESLPAESMIFLDAGNCVGWGIHYFTVNTPMELHSALAMGPMGFGVGAVIGAKLGCPHKTCIALVGDGAFMMHGSEVSTAQANRIGAIWVVFQEDDLLMVSQGMGQLFPDSAQPGVWSQLYQLGQPDLVSVARGFGADAYLISSPAELKAVMPAVLEGANLLNRPQVIVARIQKDSLNPYFGPKPSNAPHQATPHNPSI
jgi:acetolactate synthase-1/2/3 large subunit